MSAAKRPDKTAFIQSILDRPWKERRIRISQDPIAEMVYDRVKADDEYQVFNRLSPDHQYLFLRKYVPQVPRPAFQRRKIVIKPLGVALLVLCTVLFLGALKLLHIDFNSVRWIVYPLIVLLAIDRLISRWWIKHFHQRFGQGVATWSVAWMWAACTDEMLEPLRQDLEDEPSSRASGEPEHLREAGTSPEIQRATELLEILETRRRTDLQANVDAVAEYPCALPNRTRDTYTDAESERTNHELLNEALGLVASARARRRIRLQVDNTVQTNAPDAEATTEPAKTLVKRQA